MGPKKQFIFNLKITFSKNTFVLINLIFKNALTKSRLIKVDSRDINFSKVNLLNITRILFIAIKTTTILVTDLYIGQVSY